MGQTLQYLKPLPVTMEIEYPESDGKPMGETAFHILVMMYLLGALKYFFRDAPDVYVGSNMLMYYEDGDTHVFVVPDLFVSKRTRTEERRVWKTWDDGVPAVIFEITSRGTRIQDLTAKRGLYQLLGVREYIMFDPLDEYLEPRLQGYRLVDEEYHRVPLEPGGELYSAELNLFLRAEDRLLRAIDPETQVVIPTLNEAMDRVEQEAARAEREEKRAQAETERAQAEAIHAQSEADRAAQAEAEVARLRAEIEKLRGKPNSE